MQSEYAMERDGGLRVSEFRSTQSCTHSRKAVRRSAIAFYLDHKAAIDKYLEDTEREFEASGIPRLEANPALWSLSDPADLRDQAFHLPSPVRHVFPR